jgi:hypothetical protein
VEALKPRLQTAESSQAEQQPEADVANS